MAQPLHPDPDALESQSSHVPFAAIADHEIIQIIGRGGCGEVWLGRNVLGTHRAIKVVYQKTFRHRRPFEREFNGVKRFEPISRLHDGLMDVLQVGGDDQAGYFYCVMELADDVRVGQVIDPGEYSPRTLAADAAGNKRLAVGECLRIGIAIADALSFLHGRGLIHRDIKPSNIVFVNGVPKLADVGLVAELTDARSYVGTDGFIPPEGPGTIQADLYSLGKVLYEIMTGKDRRDYPELPTQLEETVHERELVELNKIVLKACRSNPRERYQSAEEMRDDLRTVQGGGSVKPPAKRKFAVLAVVGLVLSALAVVLEIPSKQKSDQPAPQNPLAPKPAAVPGGLVAWWRAEGDALESVSGVSGALRNGARLVPEGEVGSAFSFDGSNFVSCPDRPELRITGPITVEAWVCPATNFNYGMILSKWDAVKDINQRSYVMGCFPRGRPFFTVSSNGYDGTLVGGQSPLPLNQWSHLAGTYDGTNLSLYVNGVLEGEVAYRDGIYPGTNDIILGATTSDSPESVFLHRFCGMIDEVSIYNRGLTPDEIRAIYNAKSAGKQPLPASLNQLLHRGLVGWWRCEGDAQDMTGSHHGTLMNGTSFAPGKIGQAFSFDGTDDYVMVPKAGDLDPGTELTIDFWMKSDPKNWMDDCCQGLVTTDFYSIEISPGDSWVPGINFANITDHGAPAETLSRKLPRPELAMTTDPNAGAAIISPGVWHYVAGTYDGNCLQLYIDGKPWGDATPQMGAIFPMFAESFLTFGSEDGRTFCPFCPGHRYYKGLLDEIRIFNRALSPEEIQRTYELTAGDLLDLAKGGQGP